MAQNTYSHAETITTTAGREIQVLARTKSIWVTVAILIVSIVGMIGFFSWQANKDSEEPAVSLAVVGVPEAAFADAGFDVSEASSRADAEKLVRNGDVDTAVVASEQGWEVLEDGEPSMSTLGQISSIATRYASTEALSSLGLTPEQYASAMPNTEVTGVDISAGGQRSEADFAKLLTAFVALLVTVFTVILFAANIGSRVTAEKSSRVIELILAAVLPMDFLAGKILGNVAMGLALTVLIIGSGVVALFAFGLTEMIEFSFSILPIMLLSWLLAMLFFGALYAAAGSLVQRTEDLQSTQAPILFLLMGSMYVPFFGWMHTDATWMQALSWIPPFSIFTAPITYAGGDFTATQLLGSYALALVATAVAIWLAGRIYRSSILYNGGKRSWLQAIRA
ncbi:ABC transporter permease [Corynebacterium sanguinis]|uniref:ABC transporter permease n=1 Tax=Corynebacterium sanguinis TaxID=2594913 RepID=A0A6C1TVH9_9CORY|nr:ABC transporter permease [Corynebacterium sanguinis]MBA4506220.1 ABC transporter permease [Corynebacterium sanguinis]MCT1463663.1 ABC transporter permease [Corynebacterium sanguinis]MCT1629215.1 ABC transporter permease [Corynebacterium sanguinis]MCT1694427.1 ABC transporter permease [Corynebacterium sanguinis]MCT1713836.1 ABC transporter permease [Corynebacterium sanguinis]